MSIVTSPEGYPNILLVNNQDEEFFLANGYEGGRKNKYITPVFMTQLRYLFDYKHKDTNRFLKRFGQNWCVSNGMIFFRKDCNASKSQETSLQQCAK
jgi:hypothetical protein